MFKKILGVVAGLMLIPFLVSAAPVVSVNKGGTGTTTLPTYGQLFVGNSSGGWDYFATSSLGMDLTPWSSDIAAAGYDLLNVGSIGIGTSTPSTELQISSNADADILFDAYTGTGAYQYQLYSNGNTFYLDSITSGGYAASPNFQFQNADNGGLFYLYGDGSFANNSSNSSDNYIYGDTYFNADLSVGDALTVTGSTTVNNLLFDTSPSASSFEEGRMFYDSTHKTVSLDIDSDVTLQLGEEILIYVEATENILNGEAVYLAGSSGDFPTVTKAKADAYATAYVLGVATQDITSGQKGFITEKGLVHDMNTNSWTSGDSLYLSTTTAGALVNYAPKFPNFNVRVGRVIVKSATVGSIFVNARQLNQLSALTDVNVVSPSSDQVLTYSGSGWINKDASIGVGTGVVEYFQTSSSTLPVSQKALARTPQVVSETIYTNSTLVSSANSPQPINAGGNGGIWISPEGGLGVTSIPAGVWAFDYYGYNSAKETSGIQFEIYASSTTGVSTLLFRTATSTMTAILASHSDESIQPAYSINSTDRLVIKVLATQTGIIGRSVYFYVGGTDHYSHVKTPITQKHNDLAGLQGGTASQFYHLTLAEYSLLGSRVGLTDVNSYIHSSTTIPKTYLSNTFSEEQFFTSIGSGGDLTIDANGDDIWVLGGTNFQLGNSTNDAGDIWLRKGAQSGDPQVILALSADANGDFSITTDTGDIDLVSAGKTTLGNASTTLGTVDTLWSTLANIVTGVFSSVRIGTDTAQGTAQLTLYGDGGIDNLALGDGSDGYSYISNEGGTLSFSIDDGGSYDFYTDRDGGSELQIATIGASSEIYTPFAIYGDGNFDGGLAIGDGDGNYNYLGDVGGEFLVSVPDGAQFGIYNDYEGGAEQVIADFNSTASSIYGPLTLEHASTTQIGSTGSAYLATSGGNVGIGTTTPQKSLAVSAGASATTTVQFGDVYSGTGKTCFEVGQSDGSIASFYFVGGAMVIETNACVE